MGKSAPFIFMGKTDMKLSKEDLEKDFVYDETSSTCLRWKHDSQEQMHVAGAEAGYVPKSVATPYIFYHGHKVSNALIIWILHGRCISRYTALSPIDGDLRNVRIGNLQEVTIYLNPL